MSTRNADQNVSNDTQGGTPQHLGDRAANSPTARFWKEIHESMAGVILFLAAVHILGVVVSSYVDKENLILAMITGKKVVKS